MPRLRASASSSTHPPCGIPSGCIGTAAETGLVLGMADVGSLELNKFRLCRLKSTARRVPCIALARSQRACVDTRIPAGYTPLDSSPGDVFWQHEDSANLLRGSLLLRCRPRPGPTAIQIDFSDAHATPRRALAVPPTTYTIWGRSYRSGTAFLSSAGALLFFPDTLLRTRLRQITRY